MPGSPLRTFYAASIVGTWVGLSGHSGPLKAGERSICTTISRTERRRVCELLGIKPHTFDNAVPGWIEMRLAHRCNGNVTCLFVTPLHGDAACCPACRAPLVPESGSNHPRIREQSSPNQGEREAETAASTSDNGSVRTRWLQGGGEGVPAAHAHDQTLEPEDWQEILDIKGSESPRPRKKYLLGEESA
jgi:hypothetical protein